jgi:hypothetical protein
MAIDVTVLGASGTTVTIPFTSAANAAAAQAALGLISNQVTGGSLQQVNYTGGGTLPAITEAGATVAGVLALNSGASSLPSFGLSTTYVSAVLGSAAVQDVVVGNAVNGAIIASGAGGSTVSGGGPTVTGTGGTDIFNLGTNTEVFMSGAATENFSEVGTVTGGVPTANVWVTTAEKGTANFVDGAGSTTVNLDALQSSSSAFHVFGQILVVSNAGAGETTINVTTPTVVGGNPWDGDAFSFRGTGTSVATTVNAAGQGSDTSAPSLWVLLKSANGFINGNGSDVILFPTSNSSGTGVTATLFGGSGTDIDVGAAGSIIGGSAGNNILFGGVTAASSTLFGGGSGDQLIQQGAGNVMTAGVGNEFLFALAGGNTINGFAGTQPAGDQTLMDGTTGGDTFVTGNAANGTAGTGGTNIFSVNDTNGGNLFQEGQANTGTGVDANSATINGFVSGLDSISLADPAGGNYTVGASGANGITITVAGGNSTVTFGDGTTWTVISATVLSSDFKVT